MKDTKTLLLLFVSLLLIIASVALFWSWGYQISFGRKPVAEPKIVLVKDSSSRISDSLQKAYYLTLNKLDNSIDSIFTSGDSLKGDLDTRLKEFYELRKAITDIFAKRTGDNDIIYARQKIAELQERVMRLRISNEDVQTENRRLNALLLQLATYQKQPSNQGIFAKSVENRAAPKTNSGNDFIASDLKLTAEREEADEDNSARLTGSFMVKNNSGQSSSSELVVVLLQPDGKVLQKSAWESGTFETNEGKRVYSCKLKMDYENGEAKKLWFSIDADRYQKGNYTLQLYYKGNMIARMTKQMG